MQREKYTIGVELQEGDVPSPDHDIWVLTRPNSAAEGCCLPKTAVTFREPGKTAFQLELPLNSPLKNIKATLLSATRSSRREKNGNGVVEEVARTDGRDARDCTLIVGGQKMSNSYLLGDYFLMKSTMRRTPTILVLWHPLRLESTPRATPSEARLPRFGLPPVASFAAATSAPLLIASREEGRIRGRHLRSRRSVKRRCKVAARFSGLKRGARCGLGIRPLS